MALIVGIVLGIVSFIFIVQNLDTVSYDFLVWSVTAPRFLFFYDYSNHRIYSRMVNTGHET